jgi:hypothetical protein
MLLLLADENVPAMWIGILRECGHDVETCVEAGLLGADDPAVLEYATSKGRALITNDGDFREVHTRWFLAKKPHGGIILYSSGFQKIPDRFRQCIEFTLRNPTNSEIQNQVIAVIGPPSA